LAIGLLGLAINSSAMAACVEILSLPYVTGKVVASSLTVGVNFTLRRWLLFSSVPRFLSDAELPSERRT
jgi:putative flippase GtrA